MPWKKYKSETARVAFHFFRPLFAFQKQPPKITLKSNCSKMSQKEPWWISVLVAEHRPSYLNYAVSHPWNLK